MRNYLTIGTLVLAIALSLVGITAVSAQEGDATLLVINYVGTEMVFTLDGTAYTVPGTSSAPEGGQMEFPLSSGQHEYSGLIPGGPGSNGQLDLAHGQTYVLGARLERTSAVLSPDGIVLEKPKDELVFFEASLTAPAPESTVQRQPLQPIPDGQAALVIDNYIGEELNLDIDGTIYTAPANGRLQINLAPGEVAFSASAGVSSTSHTVSITAGEYTGLGFSRDYEASPEYDVGEPEPTVVPLEIRVEPVSLVGEEVATPTPIATPETVTPEGTPAVSDTTSGMEGLTVVNYTAYPLTFTVDDKAYLITENGGKMEIDLPDGRYTYTAATPLASYNGEVMLEPGLMLSVASNLAGDQIQVYAQ